MYPNFTIVVTVLFQGCSARAVDRSSDLLLSLLFHVHRPDETLSNEVTEMATKVAVDIMRVACQQTAFIAGRGAISKELHAFETGTCISVLCIGLVTAVTPLCRVVYTVKLQYLYYIHTGLNSMSELKFIHISYLYFPQLILPNPSLCPRRTTLQDSA